MVSWSRLCSYTLLCSAYMLVVFTLSSSCTVLYYNKNNIYMCAVHADQFTVQLHFFAHRCHLPNDNSRGFHLNLTSGKAMVYTWSGAGCLNQHTRCHWAWSLPRCPDLQEKDGQRVAEETTGYVELTGAGTHIGWRRAHGKHHFKGKEQG